MRIAALLTAGAVVAGALIVSPQTGSAQDAASAIEARKDIFQTYRTAIRAIKPIVQSGSGYAEIIPHANAIADGASRVTAFFPEGSDQGDTKARPEIWSNKADFESLSDQLRSQALELAAAAETGEAGAVQAAFMATGQACSACHDKYRY